MPLNSTRRSIARLATLALAVPASLAVAQPARPPAAATAAAPAQVMILGTFHMGGTSDMMAGPAIDVLHPDRQRELEQLAAALAEFRPTRILVEIVPAAQARLDSAYRAVRTGSRPLGRSETEQLGFRLAQRLGHERVHAVDFRLDEPIGALVGFAQAQGDTAFVGMFRRFAAQLAADNARFATRPLAEVLEAHNTPAYDAQQRGYMRVAQIGVDSNHVGARLVAGRYERNLRIYANIARHAAPGERLLVIYGAGHGKLLRDFVRETDGMQLVDPIPYLRRAAALR